MDHLHAVAIAGGSGTRFWPLSRSHRPKQLLSLFSEETLLTATLARLNPLVSAERHWMVVGQAHAEACHAAAPQVPGEQVLVEPMARNTAPAIALAALHLMARDPDAIMAVFPADHHVRDAASLSRAVEAAAHIAAEGAIVTLGIEPAYPETGYGYIQRGDSLDATGYRVARFREKPERALAEKYIESGEYYWNAGIFVMRAAAFMQELTRQLPSHAAALADIADAIGSAHYESTVATTYASLEPVSIDYGVMEGAENVCVVPVECGWSDVGSLAAMLSLGDTDEQGNATAGKTIAIDSQRSIIHSSGEHVVAVVGLSDIAVVHTDDATLVVPVERAQDVRAAVGELQARDWKEYL